MGRKRGRWNFTTLTIQNFNNSEFALPGFEKYSLNWLDSQNIFHRHILLETHALLHAYLSLVIHWEAGQLEACSEAFEHNFRRKYQSHRKTGDILVQLSGFYTVQVLVPWTENFRSNMTTSLSYSVSTLFPRDGATYMLVLKQNEIVFPFRAKILLRIML